MKATSRRGSRGNNDISDSQSSQRRSNLVHERRMETESHLLRLYLRRAPSYFMQRENQNSDAREESSERYGAE